MVLSSVSPDRWLTMVVKLLALASSIASRVSVSEPIWLTLIRIELAERSSIPRYKRSTFITKRSSPTN